MPHSIRNYGRGKATLKFKVSIGQCLIQLEIEDVCSGSHAPARFNRSMPHSIRNKIMTGGVSTYIHGFNRSMPHSIRNTNFTNYKQGKQMKVSIGQCLIQLEMKKNSIL